MMVTNDYQYDVLYLGSGHGAFNGALALGAKGDFKIGMVEADKLVEPALTAVATPRLRLICPSN